MPYIYQHLRQNSHMVCARHTVHLTRYCGKRTRTLLRNLTELLRVNNILANAGGHKDNDQRGIHPQGRIPDSFCSMVTRINATTDLILNAELLSQDTQRLYYYSLHLKHDLNVNSTFYYVSLRLCLLIVKKKINKCSFVRITFIYTSLLNA